MDAGGHPPADPPDADALSVRSGKQLMRPAAARSPYRARPYSLSFRHSVVRPILSTSAALE